jgi:enoyl-CoA hydratase/carnithine racemase
MDFETLLVTREGNVATVTLNRPARMNAIDGVMIAELPRAWETLARDPDTWVVILTGAGDRAFCAGMDLRDPPPPPPPGGARARISPRDCGLGKPVVCAVNGVCAGGGIGLVPDSDIVICSESAYFTDTRTSVGQLSVYGSLAMMRRIPIEAVFRLAFLGRHERLTAQRARQLGLVSEVVAQEALLPRARELAEAVAKNSPAAVMATRNAIWDSLDTGLGDALEMGWNVITRYAAEETDAREGARAFAEKRAPKWSRQRT